ncbi:unnamed protein product (macronuclear) [Paramecium tetraurelia]|uniref:RING-type E3 ubiquitin transferase n=1 Tax=Paramecium tetraurelia TaxID=5888 RepID=A0BX52_PARTE|nr:uncharacterized protein GSPATT00032971001 [Paramecium tetraurelia]CAK63119.1 unnamed protein product [Paramecium tetraurelia]|eukprot:XP_001430517.1 hypothetical protein (macronuclear) [Paramecium tetraurelia strain d4-2]
MKNSKQKFDINRLNYYEGDFSEFGPFILFRSIFPDQYKVKSWTIKPKEFKQNCQALISNNELSFQCFTCGIEATHIYCQECFDPNQHLGHQCIINGKSKGLCDCGSESIISKQGFCSKHRNYVLDDDDEIKNISIKVQKKITNILQSLIVTFTSTMKQIKGKSNNQIAFLILYHFATLTQNQDLMQTIEEKYPIESTYRLIKKASNIHTLIFNTIGSLINYRYRYLVFIQNFLSEKNCQNSKYTYLEKILKYQVYLEPFQDFKIMKIDKILYQLYADEKSKRFLFSIILKNFSKLWWIDTFRVTKYDSKVKFNNLNVTLCTLYVYQINSALKQNSCLINFVYISNLLITESQFVSFEMQKQFFSQNQNIQDLIVTMEKLHYSSGALCSQSQLALPLLFRRRFQYKAFGQIALDQLKEILKNNFDSFAKQDIKFDLIYQFNYNNFAITTLINSLGKGIMKISQNKQNQEIILADVVHYIIDQATYYSAIRVGLENLFKRYSNEMFEKNIIKLLFYQTYQILKNNTFINKHINNDIADRLLCLLENYNFYPEYNTQKEIKQGMVIQKLFISYLAHLYCTTQFKNGGLFLDFLLDILDENEQEFKNFLNSLLGNIVQVYLTIHCNQNKKLQSVYQGAENFIEYSQFHRVDTCLFKLYIFLYGEHGFSQFQNMLETFKVNDGIFKVTNQTRIIQQLFASMILTDLDLYNVCSPLLTTLSNDLKLTLVRMVGNYFIISNSIEYGDILEKLQKSGVLITKNFSNHILQICELDQTTKKLKLKAEYQIFYEPSLIQNQKGLNTQIIERLIEKQKSESEILLGNGIIWDIQQFSNQRYKVLQHLILMNFCQNSLFLKNLKFLQETAKSKQMTLLNENTNFLQEMCQLIYAQLAFHNTFNQILFQEFVDTVRVELEKIYNMNLKKEEQQKIKVLISSINELNKSQIQENQQTKLKFQAQKDRYKAKFNQIQSSNLIQQMLNEEQQQEIAIKDENLCYACKLSLKAQNSVGTLSIFLKPKPQMYDGTHEKLENLLKFNLCLGIQTCQHYFHNQCLTKYFQSDQIRNQDFGYYKLDLNCPICKQSVIQRFPIDDIDKQKLKSFNSDLLLINDHLGLDFEQDQMNKLVQIYINLFFDLVTSLFMNAENYRRAQKNVLFKQLLICFYETIQEMDQNSREMLNQVQIPKQKNNLVFNTVRSIYNILTNQSSFNELKLDIIELISKSKQLSKDEISLFLSSFGIEEAIMEQQLNAVQNISKEDYTLNFYQTLQSQAVKKIYNKLGPTFLQFHSKYFSEKCDYCKFQEKIFSYSGISVCLLCQKVFCNKSCIIKNKNNLEHHATNLHEGNSIFVSLQDSSVTLICDLNSTQKFKCLYYNNLGERINSENPHSDWNTFLLDFTKANELALIILNDRYDKINEIQENQIFT